MLSLVLTGPEATGKTALSQALQQQQPLWPLVPEYARYYFERHQQPQHYQSQDLIYIAQIQQRLENQIRINSQKHQAQVHLICDTDLLVIEVWWEVRYASPAPLWIQKAWREGPWPRFYLLCYPDLPYQADPQREHPKLSDRLDIFERYWAKLEASPHEFRLIRGSNRFAQAWAAVAEKTKL